MLRSVYLTHACASYRIEKSYWCVLNVCFVVCMVVSGCNTRTIPQPLPTPPRFHCRCSLISSGRFVRDDHCGLYIVFHANPHPTFVAVSLPSFLGVAVPAGVCWICVTWACDGGWVGTPVPDYTCGLTPARSVSLRGRNKSQRRRS